MQTDPRTAAGQVSPDGKWMWDGARWTPTDPRAAGPIAAPARAPTAWTAIVAGILGIVAIPFILAGCFFPFVYYNQSSGGGSSSVFDLGFAGGPWFAAEPVAVMLFSLVPSVLLLLWHNRAGVAVAAGALMALGVQTLFLFIGYTGGDLSLGRMGAGGPLGMFGGLLLFVGGALAASTLLTKSRAE